jgi:hypothetical protein
VHGLREGSCVTVFLVAHPRHQNSNGPIFLIVARMCFRCSPFAVSQSRRVQRMAPLPAAGGARLWHLQERADRLGARERSCLTDLLEMTSKEAGPSRTPCLDVLPRILTVLKSSDASAANPLPFPGPP